jgi:TonB family protein
MARQTLSLPPSVKRLGVLGVLAASAAQAQPPGSAAPESKGIGGIVGVVTDSSGAGIAGAQLTIVGVVGRGGSDASGSFRLIGVPVGRQMLIVRRIGFRPDTSIVTVVRSANITAEVRLAPAPEVMATVVVDGVRPVVPTRLRGFYERSGRRIAGHYFTAADIERRNPHLVTDLLRTLPGVRIAQQGGQSVVTFRGQRCPPLVWLDGMPAAAGYLDPDVVHPTSLAGIEVYPGLASVPANFVLPNGQGLCGGVIALWSRAPPPPRPKQPRRATDEVPEPAPALTPVYHANEVETPAAVDTAYPIAPVYPDSLLRAGVDGRALVEFVVDSAGAPEMKTFSAVLSTHVMFTESARRAVGDARFVPATKGGRRVRQLVQLPLEFSAPKEE